MSSRKKIARFCFLAATGAILMMGLAASALYFYQDEIIRLFVTEANKHIRTKVAVGQIEVSWWEKFPQVSVGLKQVVITEAVPGSKAPLATLKSVYGTFSLWDLWKDTYRVREIHLEDGEVLVRVLPNGEVNYLFYQAADTTQNGKLSFDLEAVKLHQVHVTYQDIPRQQRIEVQAHDLVAQLKMEEPVLNIQAQGKVLINTIHVSGNNFFQQKEIELSSNLSIQTAEKKISIAPSEIKLGKAEYQVGGTIAYANKAILDLAVQGKNTNVQSLLELLPKHFTKQLAQYRSEGDVYFKGSIKGEASSRKIPFLDISFGCRQASFYHPEYKEKLEQVSLEGRFSNGKQHSNQTSVLEIRKLKGTIQGKPFSGDLVYRNFVNPDVKAQLKAEIDVAHALGIFPVADIQKGSGQAKVQYSFAGNLRLFKANPSSPLIQSSGEVALQNVTLKVRQHPLPLSAMNGTFMVRRNDVVVTDFKGRVGRSDFLVNGYFKNALAWIFLPGQHLRMEADFASQYIDLNQLLAASSLGKTKTGTTIAGNSAYGYAFNMPANLEVALNASVRQLQFKKFRAKQLHGQLKLQNKVITTSNISLKAVGGAFKVRGTLDARRPLIHVNSVANLEDIQVDSLFYAFDDFGQHFLTQRHLRGNLTAQVNSDLFFDHNLNPRTDLMQASIKTTLRNGQLLSFEPLQKLGRFIERRELANMRFSEIRNNFWIQDRTVYVPEMEIKSSTSRFSSIMVSGTHTFDQDMDYRLRIPLANKTRKPDKDERFGTVAAGSTLKPMLFLTLKGKEGNFKIAYDKQSVKNKIANDLKREKQELKDVLRGKSKKKEEPAAVKPSTEYFDFGGKKN